jgi:hypothetical protein
MPDRKMPSTPEQQPARTNQPMQDEYGHSSGDRNTRTDEHEWKKFKDGKTRTEHVDGDGSDITHGRH